MQWSPVYYWFTLADVIVIGDSLWLHLLTDIAGVFHSIYHYYFSLSSYIFNILNVYLNSFQWYCISECIHEMYCSIAADLFISSVCLLCLHAEPCDGSAELLSYYGSPVTGFPASGIVSVCYQSSEYLVCDDGWDFADAKVACRSAGLSPYGIKWWYFYGWCSHLPLKLYSYRSRATA